MPLRRNLFNLLVGTLALGLGLLLAVPARADPASTLQTLMIVDQGDFLTFQWSFYYVDFPARFTLKEKQQQPIALDDPATIYQNVSDIVSVAFDLRIDGQPVQPEKISRLTISPNKICTVTLIYRGHPGGQVELRAPVLQYLPPIAMINYEILKLGSTTDIVTGNLVGHPGPFPQVIDYQEVSQASHVMPGVESAALALFKSQLRTAWINSNWLLIGVILLVTYRPPRVIIPLAIMAGCWIAVCVVYAACRFKVAWMFPELFPAVLTTGIGLLAAVRPRKWTGIVLLACGAALLNACDDLQQVQWTPENQAGAALVGLCAGFVAGFGLIIVILTALLAECRKFPEFQSRWAPRLCWVMAALALILPLQKFFFH